MSTSNVINILTRQPIDLEHDQAPRPGECVACFVSRMVERHGCSDQLRWAGHWRETRAPRATALCRRLERRGARCDCAAVGEVWTLSPGLWEWDPDTGAPLKPTDLPQCAGVRTNSSQPCELWLPPRGLAL